MRSGAPSTPSKLKVPADLELPIRSRHTTDLLFLLLLILSWIGMTVIMAISVPDSNIDTILHPVASDGTICGVTTGFEDVKNMAYADIAGNGVCVAECYTGATIENPTDTSTDLICKTSANLALSVTELLELSECLPLYQSFQALNRCLPSSPIDLLTLTSELILQDSPPSSFTNTFDIAEKFVNDVYISTPIILGVGIGGSLVISYLWLFGLRTGLVGILTWVTLIGLPLLLAAIGYSCYYLSGKTEESDLVVEDWQETAFFVTAIVFWAFAGLSLLLIIGIRKRVKLAVKTTRTAARALIDIPSMIALPFLQLLGFLIFLIVWAVYMGVVASTGEMTEGVVDLYGVDVTYTYFEYTDLAKRSFWFLLFVLIWTAQWLVSMGQVTLSVAFSSWYFSKDKKSLPCSGIFSYLCTSLRYHAGTAAFGSLLVAIVQFIRAVLTYVQRRIETLSNSPADSIMPYRQTARVLSGCCFCCLWCLEKAIKFVNKNAFCQTAILGSSFCKGCFDAWSLLSRNIIRVFALTFVSELIFILTKVWVVGLATIGAYYALDSLYGDELYSIYGVLIFVAALGWFVADLFTDVLEVGVATILQCFLVDEELYGVAGDHCPRDLRSFFKEVEVDSQEEYGGGRSRRSSSSSRRSSRPKKDYETDSEENQPVGVVVPPPQAEEEESA